MSLTSVDLVRVLQQTADRYPGSTAKDLARQLRAAGHNVSKRDINPHLYGNAGFVHDGSARPRWFVRTSVGVTRGVPDPDMSPMVGRNTAEARDVIQHRPLSVAPLSCEITTSSTVVPIDLPADFGGIPLHPWQQDALRAWFANGRRGVVEAVTGTGKTNVGLASIQAEVAQGQRAMVLVPTVELQDQWLRQLERHLPGMRCEPLGGGKQGSDARWDVLVAVVNSAAAQANALDGKVSLVVADECHRYGADKWAAALLPAARGRLGLTATYERNDDGIARRLNPYFGGICFQYHYDRAIPDNVIAPFVLALIGVGLTSREQNLYDELSQKIADYSRKLAPFRDPDVPFMEAVSALANQWLAPGSRYAKGYLRARQDRLDLVSGCRGKENLVPSLAPLLKDRRSLIFTEQKASAEHAAKQLTECRIKCAALHSGLDRATRSERLEAFREGRLSALAAPRVLDEGVDVPEADLGLVMASTKTKRQMIQRMGRVLRRKEADRHARFILVYAEGTFEDPDGGAHEGFLDMVREHAREYRRFDPSASAAEIGTFLDGDAEVTVVSDPLSIPAPHQRADIVPNRDPSRAVTPPQASGPASPSTNSLAAVQRPFREAAPQRTTRGAGHRRSLWSRFRRTRRVPAFRAFADSDAQPSQEFLDRLKGEPRDVLGAMCGACGRLTDSMGRCAC